MRIVIPLIFLLATSPVLAESELDKQIKNSFLTLSAFECSVISPSEIEAERLFLLGLDAGREFIAYVNANSDSYKTEIGPKVAILWALSSGPTSDFILGQVYSDRADTVYEDFTIDDELWKIKKGIMYKDKNCALLGKWY
jgi:hypothetical protein